MGVDIIFHYLDDFLVMGSPGSDACKHSLDLLMEECSTLGVPPAPEKLEDLSPVLTFLGIEIDTIEGVMRLTSDKLQQLSIMTTEWLARKSCTRKESLIGTLQHACKVEDSLIRMLGRWSSSAFLAYIRTPREDLACVSRVIATS